MTLHDLLYPEEYCPDTTELAAIEAEEAFWALTPFLGDVAYPAEPYFPPLDEGQDDPLPS